MYTHTYIHINMFSPSPFWSPAYGYLTDLEHAGKCHVHIMCFSRVFCVVGCLVVFALSCVVLVRVRRTMFILLISRYIDHSYMTI